ncbi:MAG: glycosyltransferase family 2 protein [Planctomycetota bacterium]
MTPAARTSTVRRHLAVVLPAFNEQDVLGATVSELLRVVPERVEALGMTCVFIFVNDGSTDATPRQLDHFAELDDRIRVVHLTRNFGHQPAVTAGLAVALDTADVIAVMDCDLQDPPAVMCDMVEKLLAGHDVVYGVRRNRKESIARRFGYAAFYRLLAAVSDFDIPRDSGDFCVMDRRVVELMEDLPERQRFVRGLRAWVGLRQTGHEYDRPARHAGTTHYSFRAMCKFASDGLVSFSSLPLGMVTRAGALCGIGALALLAWVIVDGVFGFTNAQRGWPSMAALVLFVGAVQLISLGILGEYLGRVFAEVKGRPTYLIARVSPPAHVGKRKPAKAA